MKLSKNKRGFIRIWVAASGWHWRTIWKNGKKGPGSEEAFSTENKLVKSLCGLLEILLDDTESFVHTVGTKDLWIGTIFIDEWIKDRFEFGYKEEDRDFEVFNPEHQSKQIQRIHNLIKNELISICQKKADNAKKG